MDTKMVMFNQVYGTKHHFQQYLSDMVAVSFVMIEETGVPRENYRPVTDK